MKAKIIIDGKECEIVSPEERIKLDDDMFLYGMSVRQNGKRIHPNNMIPDTKPMTNKSILEGWEAVLNRSKITGSIHDRYLICLSPKEDHLDDNEYVFLDEWIKSKLQAQREKDKERLLEGVAGLLGYRGEEPALVVAFDTDDVRITAVEFEDIKQLINKIYE